MRSIQQFLKRFRRKPPPDLWQLARDARGVMQQRILLAASGRLSAHEARRMIVEKQSAAVRAQFAYLQWLFDGKPAAASDAAFAVYQREVRSNRKRLARTWWR
jgi:hypothetical protein